MEGTPVIGTRVATLISLAALVVVPVACGGDDDDASDVTKEEFIANADAICKASNDKIGELFTDLPDDTTSEQAAQLTIGKALPIFRDQVDQLRELDLPAADADDLEQLWDDLDASTDELEQQLEDDPETAFSEDFDPFADESKTATDYGMTQCGA
jgi:hypothetical protein